MTSRIRDGFTLMEVMLVVVIIGFIAAIATPTFINSMKGQRLRQATRSVVAAGKYARTMAVAGQRTMKLKLAVGGRHLTVEEGPLPKIVVEQIYTRAQITGMTNEPALELPPSEPAPPPPVPRAGPARGMTREFEGVTIARVVLRNGIEGEDAGDSTILYKPNGTCTPYDVTLRDEDEREVVISVDFLGEASHEEL